jgi:hypothetical protein
MLVDVSWIQAVLGLEEIRVTLRRMATLVSIISI